MSKSVTIYQVYHPNNASETDDYFATEKEAEKRRGDLTSAFEDETEACVVLRSVELTREGVCDALHFFPCRFREDAL